MNEIKTVRLEVYQGADASWAMRGQTSDWTGATFSLQLRAGGTQLAGSNEAPALSIPAGGSAAGGSNISLMQATGPALAAISLKAADTALIAASANYSGELLIHRPGQGPRPLYRIEATVKRGNTRA